MAVLRKTPISKLLVVIALSVVAAVALFGGRLYEHVQMRIPGRVAAAPLPADASPEQVARRYCLAQSAGDAKALASVGWPGTGWALDPYLRHATIVEVSSAEPHQIGSGDAGLPTSIWIRQFSLSEFVVVAVTYERKYVDQVGNAPGRESRFLLLARDTRFGRWLVLEDSAA